uniref:Uncharacterized protein n=1 Tax=Ditylenchus dipsaci TaxID=166011 RepID=A0A915EUA1_9BILA
MPYTNCLFRKTFGAISIMMLGQDKDFIKSIKFNKSSVHAIYYPKAMKRGPDLCFSITYCDSILITAQHSTFAWWIGYLLNKNSDKNNTNSFIFYNSKFLFDGVGHGYQNFYQIGYL